MKFFFGAPGGNEHETINILESGELQDLTLQTAVDVLDFCRKNPPTERLRSPWSELAETRSAFLDESAILAVFQVKVKLLYGFVKRAYMAPYLGQWYPFQARLLTVALSAYQEWRDEFFKNERVKSDPSWTGFPLKRQNWTNYNQAFLTKFGV